jgi:hypothetical protein
MSKKKPDSDHLEEPSARANLKIRVTEVPAPVASERAHVSIQLINDKGEVTTKDALRHWL